MILTRDITARGSFDTFWYFLTLFSSSAPSLETCASVPEFTERWKMNSSVNSSYINWPHRDGHRKLWSKTRGCSLAEQTLELLKWWLNKLFFFLDQRGNVNNWIKRRSFVRCRLTWVIKHSRVIYQLCVGSLMDVIYSLVTAERTTLNNVSPLCCPWTLLIHKMHSGQLRQYSVRLRSLRQWCVLWTQSHKTCRIYDVTVSGVTQKWENKQIIKISAVPQMGDRLLKCSQPRM